MLKIQRLRLLLAAALVLGCLASVSGLATSQVREGARSYPVFGPGDGVRIQVWRSWQTSGEESLIHIFSGDYSIDGFGNIALPIIGKMKVSGYTVKGLEEALRDTLSVFAEQPVVIVTPLIRVTLLGAFRKPGSYRIDPDKSLWELVEEAGGVTDDCEIHKMWVERGRKVVVQGLLQAFEKGYSLKDIGVRSGDIIKAPSRKRIKFRDIMQYMSWATSFVLLYLRVTEGRY